MGQTIADEVLAVGRIEDMSRILEVVGRTTGLGFSAVARVTESRWIACAVRDEIAFGLKPGGELVLDTTICDEIRRSGNLVIIEDVELDPEFKCHSTPRLYGFRSYISVPIRLPDGNFFGTLCAIDPRPAQLKKPETVEMFKLFASLIGFHLDVQLKLTASEQALQRERENSKLREQFIAILGHDLRNPLGAIRMSSHLLSRWLQDEKSAGVCRMIDRSVNRMTELIDNVLDFAQGRLGGGFSIERKNEERLAAILNQIIQELDVSWPGRVVHSELAINRPVFCNGSRLGQMFSNLLANALMHGDPVCPVWVRAITSTNGFELSVTNRGTTIPPEVIEQLFQPFVRGTGEHGPQGLGLGLYISAEIARAHDGTLGVVSSNDETCFTFRMPLVIDPSETAPLFRCDVSERA